MCGRRREIEPADRRLGPSQSHGRSEDQLLVELCRSPVDGPADQVRVGCLEHRWREDVAADDPVGETRRARLELTLDAGDEALGLALVPLAREVTPGVAERAVRHVRVAPDALRSRW